MTGGDGGGGGSGTSAKTATTESRTQSNESRGGARAARANFCPSVEDTWMQPRGPVRDTRAGAVREKVFRRQWQVFATATGLQGSQIRSREHENNRQPGAHVSKTVGVREFTIYNYSIMYVNNIALNAQ